MYKLFCYLFNGDHYIVLESGRIITFLSGTSVSETGHLEAVFQTFDGYCVSKRTELQLCVRLCIVVTSDRTVFLTCLDDAKRTKFSPILLMMHMMLCDLLIKPFLCGY